MTLMSISTLDQVQGVINIATVWEDSGIAEAWKWERWHGSWLANNLYGCSPKCIFH